MCFADGTELNCDPSVVDVDVVVGGGGDCYLTCPNSCCSGRDDSAAVLNVVDVVCVVG